MLHEMIRRGMRIDEVINADTGAEFPAMYEHIDKVDKFLMAERGISITRLKSPKDFEWFMLKAIREDDPVGTPGYGWPAATVRWCTGHLKVHLIERYIRTLPLEPYRYIAFAADERYRLNRKSNQALLNRYPLMEWGITEAEALDKCYELGYTWDGLYEDFKRVSCWCCPLQGLDGLRNLWQNYPQMWRQLRRLDDLAISQFGFENPYGQFRTMESVRMLEVRFSFEREWWPVYGRKRSKAFYAALHRRYLEYADYIGFVVPEPKKQQKKKEVKTYQR